MTFTSSTFSKHASKWLRITAVIEICVALTMAAIGWFVPVARVGLWPTAAVLGLVGLALLRGGTVAEQRAAATDRVIRDGAAGTAVIAGLRQTGLFINENPQVELALDVTVDGGAPYRVMRKEFIPLIMLGSIAIGRVLQVKVDRKDPTRLVIDWNPSAARQAAAWPPPPPGAAPATWGSITGGPQPAGGDIAIAPAAPGETLAEIVAAAGAVGQSVGTPAPGMQNVSLDALRAHVRAHGESGWGTLEAVHDTGQTTGDERMYSCTMTMYVPGRAPWTVTSVMMVPQSVASKVVKGVSVPIKVDRDNPGVVSVEWEKL